MAVCGPTLCTADLVYNSPNLFSKQVKQSLSLVRVPELEHMTNHSELLRTLADADMLAAYADHLVALGKGKDCDLTRTALLRYTLPGWTNVYPSKGKATAAQVAQGLHALSQITLEQFKDALAVQAQVFDQMRLDKPQRRTPRFYLTQMLHWAGSQGYFGSLEPANETNTTETKAPMRLHRPKGQARLRARSVELRKDKPKHENYAIGAVAGDVIPAALQTQLDALSAYLSKLKQRPPTIKRHLTRVKQLLGWLHREKNIPLVKPDPDPADQTLPSEDASPILSLESIVAYIPINPELEDCLYTHGKYKGEFDQRRHDIKRGTLITLAKAQAKETRALIEEYLTWLGGHPTTAGIVITAVINVAKYLYRDQTEDEEYDHFEDIPVIRRLHKLAAEKQKEAKIASPTVPYGLKSVPWEDTKKVILAAQVEADLRKQSRGRPRTEGAVARDIQKLLILLLFIAQPPDRSRTIYEFEVGRTLRFGRYEGGGHFTDENDLPPNVKAEWWIHLKPEDSKTGDTYGETWDKLDDTPLGFLADGKTLYDYIALWRKQYRQVFKPTHNCLLTGRYGKALNEQGLWKRVREAFYKVTKVPVSPKELRKMYVTYLTTTGVSAQVMEGARLRMRHSEEMQTKTYDQQARRDKVAHVAAFHAKSAML